jgi:hypothetical protein
LPRARLARYREFEPIIGHYDFTDPIVHLELNPSDRPQAAAVQAQLCDWCAERSTPAAARFRRLSWAAGSAVASSNATRYAGLSDEVRGRGDRPASR